jgi:Flp pilus assembly protein TadD
MRDNHYATAVEQYRAVIAANAANVPARLGLAQALAMTDQFAAAETEARMGVKLAPELDESHYELGFVLARSGNPEAAVDEFRRAIALAPNSARNHAGLGVAYAASVGEFEGATREFAAASKLDPANPSLLADIVYVERLRARIDRDAVAAEAQVQAHPESGAARNRWAALLLRQGKTEQALDQLGKAIKLFPESWQMHYTMAVALYAAHDFAGSQGELDVAKKLGCGDRPHLQEALRAALAPRK